MGQNNIGNYSALSLSYLPVSYWDITQHTSEMSMTESSSPVVITKANIIPSNRSLVYGIKDKGAMLVGATASASTITVPLSSLYMAKNGYENKPFTINFWYQHLSNSFSSSTPVMAIGTDLKLYFSGEKFYMEFRGKTYLCRVPDWRELFFISIGFDKNSAFLYINGYQVESFGTDSKVFASNTSIVFSSDDNQKFQVSGLGLFNYFMNNNQISELVESNLFLDSYAIFNANYRSSVAGSYFLPSNITMYEEPLKNQITYRNCMSDGNVITLPSKRVSNITGSPTFSSSGVTFSSGTGIQMPSSDLDVTDGVLKIVATSLTSASGTLFYIYSGSPIYGVISSSKLQVFQESTKILEQSVTSTSTISIIFDAQNISVNINGTVYNTGYKVKNASIEYIVIGNDYNLASNNLATGKVQSVSINYNTNPLAIGKYLLDFNNAYASGTSIIKPKQDGAALWSMTLPATFSTSEVVYESSPSSSALIKTFTATDAISTQVWYAGTAGANIISGTSIKNNSSSPVTATDIVYFTGYLSDTEISTNRYSKIEPKISNIAVYVYSSAYVNSGNSRITMTSSDQDAFITSDVVNANSKAKIEGFKVNTDSNIVFAGLESNPLAISIRLRQDTSQTPATSDIITFAGPATTTKIAATKLAESFTITGSNVSNLTIDGGSSASTMYRYNDYVITFQLPTGVTGITLKNLAGFSVGSIDIFYATTIISYSLDQFLTTIGLDSYRVVEQVFASDEIFAADSDPVVSIINGYSIISS